MRTPPSLSTLLLLAIAGCSRSRPALAFETTGAIDSPSPARELVEPAEAASAVSPAATAQPGAAPGQLDALQQAALLAIATAPPTRVTENAPGVHTRLDTDDPVVALTFDACGGPKGNEYDAELIALLRAEKIPATLFLSGRWIGEHEAIAKTLADDPLFEIENHGVRHRPCSISGASAWGLPGTRSPAEVIEEIAHNALRIEQLTGRLPTHYRAATARYDDACVKAAAILQEPATNFTVNGDGGAGFSRAQVKSSVLKVKPGGIVLLHMNHPRGSTAEGLADAIPVLRERGLVFVQLRQYGTR